MEKDLLTPVIKENADVSSDAPSGSLGITGETENAPADAAREETTGDTERSAAAFAADGGPDAGDREDAAEAEDSRKREYDDFVRTHKDIDEKRIQDLINRRFKETKRLEEEVKRLSERASAYDPIIARLSEKYGVKAEETSSILEALLKDNAPAPHKESETAAKAGEAEKESNEESAPQSVGAPTSDPDPDKENRELLTLIKAGVAPERAYMLTHLDELLAKTARLAADRAEHDVVARLREKGARPAENGVSQGSGFIMRTDVSRLTKKDRELAVERALRGERVTFRD